MNMISRVYLSSEQDARQHYEGAVNRHDSDSSQWRRI
jgi:hypothetical protein